MAPAGGAAAAAPERGALACPRGSVGTYLYLHAVGVGNPVAVPTFTRYGAKRGTGSCDPRDPQLSGSHVRRVLGKHNIRTPAQGSPARPFRYVFSATTILADTLPTQGRGRRLRNVFWRKRVRTDRRRDEGVGAGGGRMGSSAWAWRSLAIASHARVLSLPWGRGLMLRTTEVGRSRRSGTVWRRRSLGSPAAVKNPVRGFFGENIPVNTIF
jgi:hypothetical protein